MNDNGTLISEENAIKQLDLLFDYYEIDLTDYEGVVINGGDAAKALGVAKKKLIKAIMRGRLEISTGDDGVLRVVQNLKGSYATLTQLEYKPISGRAKTEMDKYEGNEAKSYAVLGVMSGQGADKIQALVGPDLSTAESLGGLFLLS